MSSVHKFSAPLLLAASAVALAACATTMDDDMGAVTASTATTASTTTTTPTPSPTPTPSADTMATTGATADVMVGGAAMVATQTIVQNAAKANNLTTLVRAVQAAGLDTTLSGTGPFTVFAPTDQAFGLLPPGTVDTLLEPTAKEALTTVLTNHVVAGRLDAAAITQRIEAGGGTAQLQTVAGQPLTAAIVNGNVQLTASTGAVGFVEQADVPASNGIVHIVNGVLVPNLNTAAAE